MLSTRELPQHHEVSDKIKAGRERWRALYDLAQDSVVIDEIFKRYRVVKDDEVDLDDKILQKIDIVIMRKKDQLIQELREMRVGLYTPRSPEERRKEDIKMSQQEKRQAKLQVKLDQVLRDQLIIHMRINGEVLEEL